MKLGCCGKTTLLKCAVYQGNEVWEVKKTEKWGPVYQEIMRNTSLSVEAKAIYAYLSSIAGADGSCYPSIETMQTELNIGKNRLTKHMSQLTSSGIIEKIREKNGNIYGRNRYMLRHTHFRPVELREVELRPVEKEATTDNKKTNNKYTENHIIICPEQAPDRSGILLPLVDRSEYDVPISKIEQWKSAFPAVNVEQELQKMIAWLEANPKRKKTRQGIEKFIVSWIGRSQDRGGVYNQPAKTPVKATRFTNFEQREYDFDELERQLLDAQGREQ